MLALGTEPSSLSVSKRHMSHTTVLEARLIRRAVCCLGHTGSGESWHIVNLTSKHISNILVTWANYGGWTTAGVHFLGKYGIQQVARRTSPIVTCTAFGLYSAHSYLPALDKVDNEPLDNSLIISMLLALGLRLHLKKLLWVENSSRMRCPHEDQVPLSIGELKPFIWVQEMMQSNCTL
jgi:hypothetical protein